LTLPRLTSPLRVWAIHPEECFAFSTKDRAPFLICLEVVDYYVPRLK